jgi:hypothetical protein
MERYTVVYPRGQPGLPDDPVTVCQQLARDQRRPRIYDDPEGTNHAATRPHAGVQHLRGPDIEQLRTGASTAPPTPNDGHNSTSSQRPSASSTRSGPFFTRSWGWTQSLAIDNLHRTFLCRSSPARGTASGGSAAWLPNNLGPARRRRRPGDEHTTMTGAPTRAQTSTNVNTGANAPPLFRQVSQNLAATAMLLCGCPEAATPEERRVRQQLKALLEATRHNKRRAQLRASIRSAGGQEHRPHMA